MKPAQRQQSARAHAATRDAERQVAPGRGDAPPYIPLYSDEAEAATLGAMILEKDALAEARGLLTSASFYHQQHALIFSAVCHLADDGIPVDVITLGERLRERGFLEQIGGQAYLARLLDAVPTAASVKRYAGAVENFARRRFAYEQALKMQAAMAEGGDVNAFRGLLEETQAGLDAEDNDQQLPTWQEIVTAPPLTWVCDQLVPAAGLVVLGGDPGKAKTFVALSLAVAVATGRDFLGQFKVKQGPALFVDEETGAPTLAPRIEAAASAYGASSDTPFYLASMRGLSLAEPEGLGRLTALVRRYKPTLLVLDPWASFIAGANENSSAEIGAALAVLRGFRRQGTACGVCHHLRKRMGLGGDDASSRLRGSGALLAACDVFLDSDEMTPGVFVISDNKPRARSKLPPFKVRIQADEYCKPGLVFDGWVDEGAEADHALDRFRDPALRRLRRGPVPRPELVIIGGAMGMSERSVARHIAAMLSQGDMVKSGPHTRPVYALPEGSLLGPSDE